MDSKILKWGGLLTHAMIISALFAIAPALGAKTGEVGPLVFTCAVIVVAMIYSLMDVINEVWGKAEANRAIILATAIRIAIYLTVVPVVLAITTGHGTPEGYSEVWARTWRVFAAGEIAILAGNLIFDIPFFAWLKKKKLKGGFWVRTNLTNITSTVLSVLLFMSLAFFGVADAPPVWKLTIGQIVGRTVLTFIFSFPLTWWAGYLKKQEKLEV